METAEITTAPQPAQIRDLPNERVAGSRNTTVRAYKTEDGKQVEVVGAKCNLKSDELQASFISPATVILPTFVQSKDFEGRGRPATLRVECVSGDIKGVISVTAQNKELHTATNAGIGGAILTSLISGALASSTPWGFGPAMSVQMQ